MTSTGWFHRSGPNHREGQLRWIPAVAENTTRPTELSLQILDAFEAADYLVPPGPYPVGEVKGRSPAELSDFIGVTSFTVIRGDLTYRVFGTGEHHSGVVRFRQQDLGWDGRDIRTWLISTCPNGIVAAPDQSPAPPSSQTISLP